MKQIFCGSGMLFMFLKVPFPSVCVTAAPSFMKERHGSTDATVTLSRDP